tara:strand:- start:1604 stop:2674 length:1071 start_codon:yes stop_codon:yes gene_type:complete
MTFKSTVDQKAITDFISEKFGNEFNADAIRAAALEFGLGYPTIRKRLGKYRVSTNKYRLTVEEAREVFENTINNTTPVQQNLVPVKDDNFVKFGNFNDLKKIISSRSFYPTFITGLSGNGKTFGVEQACAQLNRELIRVNITIETDEDDLIGGFRLVDGSTVWHNGPVTEALERGAVLLLDEIDLASNKILCLQSILEGTGVFLKKIGKFVRPAAGFTVVATANTKGKGSDDGRFIGTNILNEAFLERFPITFEQQYPTVAIESKILNKLCNDKKFCKNLSDWADIIRKTFDDGGIDEVISTRRLVHVIKAYQIFANKEKAISFCLNRFDDETKQSFLELYDKVDADVEFKNASVE